MRPRSFSRPGRRRPNRRRIKTRTTTGNRQSNRGTAPSRARTRHSRGSGHHQGRAPRPCRPAWDRRDRRIRVLRRPWHRTRRRRRSTRTSSGRTSRGSRTRRTTPLTTRPITPGYRRANRPCTTRGGSSRSGRLNMRGIGWKCCHGRSVRMDDGLYPRSLLLV